MCHGECTWADDSCQENKPLPVYKGSIILMMMMVMMMMTMIMMMIAMTGCPMCLTGLGENVAMGMDKCQWVDERQLLEVGNFYPNEDGLGKYTLRPIGRFLDILVQYQYFSPRHT